MNKPAQLPKHIAIIMDGNGRWAKAKGLPRSDGHQAGAEAVRRTIEYCLKEKIEALTLFALSVENLNHRPTQEVQWLMTLFFESLENNLAELTAQKIRIRVIGDRSVFEKKLLDKIVQAELSTQNNQGLVLTIAINYSGRWDIVQAARQLGKQIENKTLSAEMIDEEIFKQQLSLMDLPEPDLLIRTGGELRISNFLLWQFAYTELFFTAVNWPDFNEELFSEALTFFKTRQRRFGYSSDQLEYQNA